MKIFNSMEEAMRASEEGGDKRSYVAAKSGFLKVVEIGGPIKPIHAIFASPSKNPDLEDVRPQIVIKNVVPIPALLIAKATAIFRHVYEKYDGAEMICLLRWKEEDLGDGRKIGRYYLDRAERVEVAAGGLEYHQHVPIVGTIHSHGAGSAFFSSTDDRWEKEDTPGIYITIGNVNSVIPSIEASIAGHGSRVKMRVPDIPKEVFEAVTLTDEEKEWWTATLTVKPYSRTEGYYIVIGDTITGWSPSTNANLHEGEKILPVQEYKPKKPKTYKVVKDEKEAKKDQKSIPSLGEFMRMSKFIHFLREKGYMEEFFSLLLNGAESDEIGMIDGMLAAQTHDTKDTPGPSMSDNIWMGKCIHFIRKRNFVQEFFDMFLDKATDEEIEQINNALDLKLGGEFKEDEWENEGPGKSPFSDAEDLDIMSQRPWDDFWRD